MSVYTNSEPLVLCTLFNGESLAKGAVLNEIKRQLSQDKNELYSFTQEMRERSVDATNAFDWISSNNFLSKHIPEEVIEWHQLIIRLANLNDCQFRKRRTLYTDQSTIEHEYRTEKFWLTWIEVMAPGAYLRNFSNHFVILILKNLSQNTPFRINLSNDVKVHIFMTAELLSREVKKGKLLVEERPLKRQQLSITKNEVVARDRRVTVETILLDFLMKILSSTDRDLRSTLLTLESAFQMIVLQISRLSWDRSIKNIQISYDCIWNYARQRLKDDPNFDFFTFLNTSHEGKAYNDPKFQMKVENIENLSRFKTSKWLYDVFVRCIEVSQVIPR